MTAKLIELPKFEDVRGNLSAVEELTDIPFVIAQVYWVYDVPGGQTHAGYAFKEREEFIIALSGSFDITIDDGGHKKTFSLNRSYKGLYIPAGLWRQMKNFSTNSLAMVISSGHFDKDDYIFEFENYLKSKHRDEQ